MKTRATKFLNRQYILLLLGIVLVGFLLRIVGIHWDQGYYLHPDERAIFLFSLPISLPSSFAELLSPESPLNPKFFAYGSFPLYFLRSFLYFFSLFSPELGGYEKGYFVGRVISILFDCGIIVLLYFVGKSVFTRAVGLLAAFFYAIAVFPIQNSHFYTSDVFLSFFLLLSFLFLLRFLKTNAVWVLLVSAAALGLAVGSKVSALPFLVVVFFALFWQCLRSVSKHKRWKVGFSLQKLLQSTNFFLVYLFFAYLVFVLVEPYAVIDFQTFWDQLTEQQRMTQSAFTFPYTLQYVGKVPYLYELSQIFWWGLGIPLGLIALCGVVYSMYYIFKNLSWSKSLPLLLCMFFFFLYFGIVGRFAVGFMRYMLPLYPFLLLFAAFFSIRVFSRVFLDHKLKRGIYLRVGCVIVFLFICSVWTFSFIRVYDSEHPRVTASEWLHKHVPYGSTIALEHWDDSLPLYGLEQYQTVILPLYEVDSDRKWRDIDILLDETEYIILSSNRLVEPLTRLSQMCEDIPSQYCYLQTSAYYKSLFSGELGFELVKKFEVYPVVPVFNFAINDQMADESFTVYDHPNVYVFKVVK